MFRELSNAVFLFSLRQPGAEIVGRSNAPPPRRWKIQRPSRAQVKPPEYDKVISTYKTYISDSWYLWHQVMPFSWSPIRYIHIYLPNVCTYLYLPNSMDKKYLLFYASAGANMNRVTLTRHRLGCFCTHHSLGGGGSDPDPPPPAISKTDGRRETDEAAFERSRRDASKPLSKIQNWGHVSGQGQVKGQNRVFSGCRP